MPKQYPKEITPHIGYLHRMEISDLLFRYPTLIVSRKGKPNSSVESATGEHTGLDAHFIDDRENVIGLSCNLLGGAYKPNKHDYIDPVLDFVKEDWDGITFEQFPIPAEKYKVRQGPIKRIFFRVSDIHCHTFPYLKHIDKDKYQSTKEKAELIFKKDQRYFIQNAIISELGNNNMANVLGRICVNHHPTILNYWHVQFDCYASDSESPMDSSCTSKEDRRIRHAMRVFLNHNAILKMDSRHYHISRKFFYESVPTLTCLIDNIRDTFYKIRIRNLKQ